VTVFESPIAVIGRHHLRLAPTAMIAVHEERIFNGKQPRLAVGSRSVAVKFCVGAKKRFLREIAGLFVPSCKAPRQVEDGSQVKECLGRQIEYTGRRSRGSQINTIGHAPGVPACAFVDRRVHWALI
jgi:hypothetical protein